MIRIRFHMLRNCGGTIYRLFEINFKDALKLEFFCQYERKTTQLLFKERRISNP